MGSIVIRAIASVAEFREMIMPALEEDRRRREAEPKDPRAIRMGFEPALMAKGIATDFLETLPKKYVKALKHDNPLLLMSSLEVARPIPVATVLRTLRKMNSIKLYSESELPTSS